jgi:FixJ family two-component response regulator
MDGLAVARSFVWDEILLDLRLPDCSGLEVLAELQCADTRSPVVVVTAFGSPAVRVACFRLGAIACAEKPIDEQVLLHLVDAYSNYTHSSVDQRGPLAEHVDNRWVSLILPVVRANNDVPTVKAWARLVGHSTSTVKQWCANVGTSASDSLTFARALSIVSRYPAQQCDWFNCLDIIDPRTLATFIDRAHLSRDLCLPDVEGFLSNQMILTSPGLIAKVRLLLSR